MSKDAKPAKSTAGLPPDYAPLLADIKARVQSARIKAGLAANRELLALYWDIGRLILDRQRREAHGNWTFTMTNVLSQKAAFYRHGTASPGP